jgi:hypothetical protein
LRPRYPACREGVSNWLGVIADNVINIGRAMEKEAEQPTSAPHYESGSSRPAGQPPAGLALPRLVGRNPENTNFAPEKS